jgi:hypothetical protein
MISKHATPDVVTENEIARTSKDLKLGELQIGGGSLFWAGARRQSAKRIHWG